MSGQKKRYEVHAIGYPNEGDNVIGWAEHTKSAIQMASAIRKAPGCEQSSILDLKNKKIIAKYYPRK